MSIGVETRRLASREQVEAYKSKNAQIYIVELIPELWFLKRENAEPLRGLTALSQPTNRPVTGLAC
jgi:hypothetical protein